MIQFADNLLPGKIGFTFLIKARCHFTIGSEKEQAVAFLSRLITVMMQNLLCFLACGLILPCIGFRGWQYHQAQTTAILIGNIGGRGKYVPAFKAAVTATQDRFQLLTDSVYYGIRGDTTTAVFHFAAQIGTGIEPIAVIIRIKIMQAVTQAAKDITEDSRIFIGLHAAQ